MTRNWSLGPAAWSWPDDVDETGCEGRMANRYLPIEHTAYGGSGWQVAQVFVDEDDDEMLADARLIAHAPDLLASLLEACEALDFAQAQVDSESDAIHLRRCRRRIKTVIDRAEGRSE